ncbi:30S ribosomal protein S13 [Candidatus Woesearchaeota archaeon]|jgi:small subunit ribosomal protein S13|nr:30S ribosomal protein S13 [Candidatus Woesearchaeota archaeon]
MAENQDYKHIIRVANTDLDGSKGIAQALKKIKGVSFMFANMLCHLAKVDNDKQAGKLNEKEVESLNSCIKDPLTSGSPKWMLNRRNDYVTGEDKHLVMGDLKFTQENDIRRMKKIKAYRGTRHMFGLPCRGQRTKSNFRRNKGKVQGVKRKAGKKGK